MVPLIFWVKISIRARISCTVFSIILPLCFFVRNLKKNYIISILKQSCMGKLFVFNYYSKANSNTRLSEQQSKLYNYPILLYSLVDFYFFHKYWWNYSSDISLHKYSPFLHGQEKLSWRYENQIRTAFEIVTELSCCWSSKTSSLCFVLVHSFLLQNIDAIL